MKPDKFILATALMASFISPGLAQNKPSLAPSQPVTETYFGKQITDPYRNLENLRDSSVQQWMRAQTDYTHAVLNSIPGRQQMMNL